MTESTNPTNPTKTRLLDAAEELFANKGFDEVSIRELAAAADVNVAAVNYHFHSKDNLFHQVIIRRFVDQRDSTLAALEEILTQAEGKPTIEEVIATLTRAHLTGAIGVDKRVNFLSFIADHMSSAPGNAKEVFFKEMVRPVFAAFSRALQTAQPSLTREDISWSLASIIGQIHHFIMRWKKKQDMEPDSETLQTMIRLFPALGFSEEQYIAAVTQHITRFSSAAIKALASEGEQ